MASEDMRHYRVVILGAGVSGTSLAYELASKGISCAVVDEIPFGAYSSTKNQGWIHGGALYVAYDQLDVARDCRAGYNVIRRFIETRVPEALPPPSTRSIYMANVEREMIDLKEKCRQLGITCEDPDRESISELRAHPRGEGFDFPVRVDDLPINTTMYLSKLSEVASQAGACFLPIEGKMKDIRVNGSPHKWQTRTAKGEIESDILIASCGVLIPDVLAKLGVDQADAWFKRERILVSVILQPIFKSLLVFVPQRHEGAPNISPFFERDKQLGSTVCLLRGETTIKRSDDFLTPSFDIDQVANRLQSYYPSLPSQIVGKPVPMHFYACQKIELGEKSPTYEGPQSQRRHIIMNHASKKLGGKEGLYSFYPGKFTAGPYVASNFANQLLEEQDALQTPERLAQECAPPEIAARQYLARPTHNLIESGGNLRINAIV